MTTKPIVAALAMLVFVVPLSAAERGRGHFVERRAARNRVDPAALPEGVRVVHDVPYGTDARQRFDVYAPAAAKDAPILFMVHGGGWAMGDKAARNVVANKVARWVPRGLIFISANYRMLPDVKPLEQARDIAKAVALVQEKAATYGGDRAKLILVGHSAGAHLVALMHASKEVSAGLEVTPWLGTIALDGASIDVVRLMEGTHAPLYDRAFGTDPKGWTVASPFHALAAGGAPFLAVCSSLREESCPAATRFVKKASSLGLRASLIEEPLTHAQVNEKLGEDGAYTDAVEAFLRSLDDSLARALAAKKVE